MYASGILPISWVQMDPEKPARLFVLLGKDAREETWSDFAGKCEKCDRDIAATASREFWEETYGVLMDARTMRARLHPSQSIELHGRTQNNHPFFCFVTEVPFVPGLRDAFRKHLTFMRQHNVHRMYLEKVDIMYCDIEQALSDVTPKRSVFKDTLMAHRDLFREIALAGPEGFAALCAARSTTHDKISDDSQWLRT